MRRHLNPLHNPYPSSSNHYITTQDSRLLHWRTSSTTTTTTTGGLDDRNFKIHGQTLLYIFILFSIILLATLLLLYARWLFRLRYLSHSPPPSSNPSPHQLLLHLSRPVSTTTRLHHHQLGLDQSTINLIPIVLYQRSSSTVDESGSCGEKRNNEVQECCICLGVFEDGDKVKILPRCHHNYHSECVDVWLCSHSSCPLCRLPVAVRVDLDPNYYPPV